MLHTHVVPPLCALNNTWHGLAYMFSTPMHRVTIQCTMKEKIGTVEHWKIGGLQNAGRVPGTWNARSHSNHVDKQGCTNPKLIPTDPMVEKGLTSNKTYTHTDPHCFEEEKHGMLIIRVGMCNGNSDTLQPFRKHSCFLRFRLQQYGKVEWWALLWSWQRQCHLTDKVLYH